MSGTLQEVQQTSSSQLYLTNMATLRSPFTQFSIQLVWQCQRQMRHADHVHVRVVAHNDHLQTPHQLLLTRAFPTKSKSTTITLQLIQYYLGWGSRAAFAVTGTGLCLMTMVLSGVDEGEGIMHTTLSMKGQIDAALAKVAALLMLLTPQMLVLTHLLLTQTMVSIVCRRKRMRQMQMDLKRRPCTSQKG